MIEKEFNYLVTNYQTPFYFFDMVSLKDRIEYLKAKLPNKVKLCYAIKANSFILFSKASSSYLTAQGKV